MEQLKTGQRVKVINGPDAGKIGTVRRLRLQDEAAWVALDVEPAQRSFFTGAEQNDVLLYPDQCEDA